MPRIDSSHLHAVTTISCKAICYVFTAAPENTSDMFNTVVTARVLLRFVQAQMTTVPETVAAMPMPDAVRNWS